MANTSIFAAFERMWQHVVAALVNKADINHSHDDVYKKNEIDSTLNTLATKSELSTTQTNLQSSINGKQATVTGAATTITGSNLTASRALVSNSSGKVAVSAVTSTELSYLDGVTSAIQTQLDGKAASSHGTHVSYSSTAPVMDGTASAGSASTVARSDHKHPVDTSRAAQTSLDSHTGNSTVHITSTERTNWNAAKTHADSTHAPSNAQANQNAFSNIKVGTTTIAAETTTDTVELVAGDNITLTPDATNDKVTIAADVPEKKVWYGTCTTAVSTSTKVVTTDSDFTLTAGNILFVNFSNPNTATSMSLNVNGLGSKTVDNASSTSSYGYLMCFVYNGARFVMSDLQSATTSKYGVTKLSSATNSTSTTLAATASAVKSAYDLANTANTAANGKAPTSHASTATTYGAGTGSNYGHVKLSDSTSTTSGASAGVAATPTAVKAAYDLANTANTAATTASSAASAAQTAASNAATTASAAQTTAEAAQVTADNASAAATAAMPKSGGTFTGTVKAKNNTSYTTGQIRNGMLVAEGASIPAGANGDLCFTYEA